LISNFQIQQVQQNNQNNITQALSQHQQKQQQFQNQPHLPPLVSVNTIPTPAQRVQTIQLTPQKQQLLKSVQHQIHELSGRIQNKNLLASFPSEFEANNPIHKTPLPVLNNINNMNDSEIYVALQRLFIEQQKILATGKIIPTLSAGTAFTAASQQPSAPISATPPLSLSTPLQHSPAVAACITNSQQPAAALSPLGNNNAAAAQFFANAVASGGFHHQPAGSSLPSPIQMISPQMRQDIVMSPLLVSAPTSTSSTHHISPAGSLSGCLQISPISSASSNCTMSQNKISPLSMMPANPSGPQPNLSQFQPTQQQQQQPQLEHMVTCSSSMPVIPNMTMTTPTITTTASVALLSPIVKVPRPSL
jgi:hypothetical protein